MLRLIEVALILAAMSAWLHRIEGAFDRWLDLRRPGPVEPALVDTDPLPDDLIAYANGMDADWAKQQTMDAMWELRGKLGTWDKVRVAMGFNSGTI